MTSPRRPGRRRGAGVLALLASLVTLALTTVAARADSPPQPGSAGQAEGTLPAGPVGGGTITLAFGGDVHFTGRTATLLRRPQTALASLRPQLEPADVAMVNLETAITERGAPISKEYRFRAPATALTAVAGAGVDVVTMANNHAVDYGPVGLADTLAARDRSAVKIVGIGRDAADAYAPAVFEVRGRTVAVLGASQLLDPTLRLYGAGRDRPGIAGARPLGPLVAAVRRARADADVVVVYVHWGTERKGCPDPGQRTAARDLVAAGADVVVGSHAHVVQGAGRLGRGYVAYGLGNFVWYGRSSVAAARTGVLTVTLDGRHVTAARWTPLTVGASGVPVRPSSAEAARNTAAFDAARRCAGLSAV